MIVGLGSGSTAELLVQAIGLRVRDGLQVTGISTSEKTSALAASLNIPLLTLEESPTADLTIDGADEIQLGSLALIKGGGGNLLREKIVALASSRMIVIADHAKVSNRFGSKSAVPVEVVPFGWTTTQRRLQALGTQPLLRMKDGQVLVTDGGHFILDCAFPPGFHPQELNDQLNAIVGVVEHGLFLGIAAQALIAGPDGVAVYDRQP